MTFHTKLQKHKIDQELYAELKKHIAAGQGNRNIKEHPIRAPSTKWFDYYLHIEHKHERLLLPFIESCGTIQGKDILDYGCGSGGTSVALNTCQPKSLTAIDPMDHNICTATLRAAMYGMHSIRFIHQPSTLHLPFADHSFDVIVANSVFEYIHEQRQDHLREIWRVLRPSGRFFLTDTSNGLFPLEAHSKRWFINYFPQIAKRDFSELGLSYWDIKKSFQGLSYKVLFTAVQQAGDQVPMPYPGKTGWFYKTLDQLSTRWLGLPLGVFTPWLNICLVKM